MTADEAITTDVGSKTFRLVRKGYDPHEVRRYLSKLADEISVLQTKAEAAPAPEPTPAPAAPDAKASATPVFVSATESTDVAASVDSSPGGPVSIDAAVEPAAEPAAAKPAGAESAGAEPATAAAAATDVADAASTEVPEPTVDAEEPADAGEIAPTISETPAAVGRGPAEGDRWAQMGQHVASVLAAADREAAAMKAGAEQHAAQRLAAVDGELELSRTALREVRRQLTEVHTLVGRSLGELPEAEHPS